MNVEVTEVSDGKIMPRRQYKRKDELVDSHIKFQEPGEHGGLPRGHKEATLGECWRAELSSGTPSSEAVRWKGIGWGCLRYLCVVNMKCPANIQPRLL